MNTEPYIRLHLYVATLSDRAVILRRGLARLFRNILWHRNTDAFEDGQWLKTRVYTERCEPSPEGLSQVRQGEPDKGCTTGIRLTNGQRAAGPQRDEAPSRQARPFGPRNLPMRIAMPPDDAADQYDTKCGCLYRRNGRELELIRDFTEMDFEPLRAPYDWRKESVSDDPAAPWHPLDRDDPA